MTVYVVFVSFCAMLCFVLVVFGIIGILNISKSGNRREEREDRREAREYELAKARLLIESGLIPNQSAHAPVSAAEQLRLENLESQMSRMNQLLESGFKKPTAVYVNYSPGKQSVLSENGNPLRRLS